MKKITKQTEDFRNYVVSDDCDFKWEAEVNDNLTYNLIGTGSVVDLLAEYENGCHRDYKSKVKSQIELLETVRQQLFEYDHQIRSRHRCYKTTYTDGILKSIDFIDSKIWELKRKEKKLEGI